MLSILLQVSHYFLPSHGPVTAQKSILHAGAVWHPVDLAQPDHTSARGQPSTDSARASSGSAPGWRVVALGEVDGMTHPAHPT